MVFDIYKNRLDDGLTTASSGSFQNFTMNQHSFFETGLTFAAMPLRIEGLIRVKVGATIKRTLQAAYATQSECSPRERGWTADPTARRRRNDVFPA